MCAFTRFAALLQILVVANPANTNALMLKEHAPGIPAENITAMTRLDHNRALAQVAQRAGVHVTQVKNVIIWGNHSSTQYPDVNHGTVEGKPIKEVLKDSSEWLDNEFVDVVQQRGAAVIKVRALVIPETAVGVLYRKHTSQASLDWIPSRTSYVATSTSAWIDAESLEIASMRYLHKTQS
eukprot:GHUV01007854.1.p1 GENE.GHUV01007854.1~~GHUV01007854.1.p1  ORF type:complete len:181 (-),score=47.32 GHUV01007854.1:1792-2334(-)